jgi:SAM-dependent methyltransferase
MQRGTEAAAQTSLNCAACGEQNAPGRLFCHRCTAPLEVASLHELNDADLAECAAALLRVVASTNSTQTASGAADSDLWLAYLSAFWLRPETALVLYAEALAQRAMHLPEGSWLDLGCGDGIHAALYSGWRFEAAFDAFQSLDAGAKDVYNHWDAAAFHADITRKGRAIELGIDIKSSAVERARALGAFKTVAEADATRLAAADKTFAVIYSNMLRDLGDPLPAALNECRRVLRDDGRLLLSAMTPAYRDSLYFAPAARAAEENGDGETARRLIRLDRGRSVFCQRQLSVEQWNDLLRPHGLVVDSVVPIVGQTVMRFWDVGLRPFTSSLLRFREHWVRTGMLARVKSAAMPLLERAMAPLAGRLHEGETCMHLLSVRKQ